MASGSVANHDFIDDDDDETEPLHDIVIDDDDDEIEENENEDVVPNSDSDSDSDTDDADTTSSSPAAAIVPPPTTTKIPMTMMMIPPPIIDDDDTASVTLAIPAPLNGNPNPNPSISPLAVTTKIAAAIEEQKQRPIPIPIDDSRKLFQRLWTNEDEIELLKGFLEYTSHRGATGGHHNDTSAFYDQIKSKLQLDFNKNQLVEKLRRLKKKYRNVVNRISTGKNFVFKSAHDQETFDISCKIWSGNNINNNNNNNNPGGVGVGVGSDAIVGRQQMEFDDEEQNPNPSLVPRYTNRGEYNHGFGGGFDQNRAIISIDVNANPEKTPPTMMMLGYPKAPSRKRSRVKMEEKSPMTTPVLGTPEGINVNVGGSGGGGGGVGVSPLQGVIEDTVRSCLSPLLKELINNAVNGPLFGGVGGGRGLGGLATNAIPLNFMGLGLGSNGELVDGRWKKQQILELEVYSKRLELVQDQIKSALEELRSMGGN